MAVDADDDSHDSPRKGLVNRLFRAVGQSVGGAAEGLLRSAGRTARDAGGRAALTFRATLEEAPALSAREIAESLTQWLLTEHQGRAELQQQKPSTIELTESGGSVYECFLEEPGLAGRRLRFLVRAAPSRSLEESYLPASESFHDEVLLLLQWPQHWLEEPGSNRSVGVWDEAAFVGRRGAAVDLLQKFLSDEFGGTFEHKKVTLKSQLVRSQEIVHIGRDEEISQALRLILTPRPREIKAKSILVLAAPGGTGKSYFLKALRAVAQGRVVWASIDHQGLRGDSGPALLGRCLAHLARGLQEQSVSMSHFSKEYRLFQKHGVAEQAQPSGFFGHLRKAAETAAGSNPFVAGVSAGVVFFTSWGQQVKEESEALAKDDSVKSLTAAFKRDLLEYCENSAKRSLCWARPVLVFDTYEWLAPLLDLWVRTDLLADDFLAHSGVLLVFSGREPLLSIDTRWSEWQSQTSIIMLHSFDFETACRYLGSLGVEESRWEGLYEFTQGLPLFLTLAAQTAEPEEAVPILTKRVLEEIPEQHHLDFLQASLLTKFEPLSLQRLFIEKSAPEREALLVLLHAATFTVAGATGRAFLPPVTRIFRRALELEIGQERLTELESRLIRE